MRGVARALAALAITGLTGCEVGPDFHRPAEWSPKSFTGSHGPTLANDGRAGSLPEPAAPDPEWWRIFGDPELTALEGQVAGENLSVREATFRLVESRAQLQESASALYPQLNATGSYMRDKLPNRVFQRGLQEGITSVPGNGPLYDALRQEAGEIKIPAVDLWQDAIDASYEVDLWGSVRRQVESARATLKQSADARRSTLISAEAELARDYVQLRGLQTELRIQQSDLESAQQSLLLTEQRYTGGLTTDLDVQNAASLVASTRAAIPNDQQQITQTINAISLLLGEPPQALAAELSPAEPVPPVPPRVPVGLPSALLLRRPDVRQAVDALHAATAEVGVAVAAFYPQVTLTGNLNELSLQFRDLFTWQSAGYEFGPSVTLPLFEGGRLRGQLRLNKAQQAEAAVNYEQTVLQAWHDVDNALTAYGGEQLRRDQLSLAVEAARKAVILARDQYAHGLINFLNVLDAERSLFSAEQQQAQSTTTVSSNLVQLYTALGGGWEENFPASDLPASLAAIPARTTPGIGVSREAPAF